MRLAILLSALVLSGLLIRHLSEDEADVLRAFVGVEILAVAALYLLVGF